MLKMMNVENDEMMNVENDEKNDEKNDEMMKKMNVASGRRETVPLGCSMIWIRKFKSQPTNVFLIKKKKKIFFMN